MIFCQCGQIIEISIFFRSSSTLFWASVLENRHDTGWVAVIQEVIFTPGYNFGLKSSFLIENTVFRCKMWFLNPGAAVFHRRQKTSFANQYAILQLKCNSRTRTPFSINVDTNFSFYLLFTQLLILQQLIYH